MAYSWFKCSDPKCDFSTNGFSSDELYKFSIIWNSHLKDCHNEFYEKYTITLNKDDTFKCGHKELIAEDVPALATKLKDYLSEKLKPKKLYLEFEDHAAGEVLFRLCGGGTSGESVDLDDLEERDENGRVIPPEELETYKPGNGESWFLIFNQYEFLDTHGKVITRKTRKGTGKDVEELQSIADRMGYKVYKRSDGTKKQIIDKLEEVSKKNLGRLVVCILTHGGPCGTLRTRNYYEENLLTVNDLWKPFEKLPDLQKIFILQACRGTDREIKINKFGVSKNSRGLKKPTCVEYYYEDFENEKVFSIPDNSVVAFATNPGLVSWRDPSRGTYFIQSLCEVFKKNPDCEINELLTRTHGEVVRKLQGGSEAQMPCYRTSLTKNLKLKLIRSKRA